MIDQDRPIAPSPRDGQLDEGGFLAIAERLSEGDLPHLLDKPSIALKFIAGSDDPATIVSEQTGVVRRSHASLALSNLRGAIAVVVVSFHASLAYLSSSPPAPLPFNQPPFAWRAFPIIDSRRWLGFDVFCAWQDVYLMSLLFFLSALFAWPSLARKGMLKFLSDRASRLGLPFIFGVGIVAPIALYPVYRTTAINPTLMDYGRSLFALPFWPNGPMWFLWELLAFTVLGAVLCHVFPGSVVFLGRLSNSTSRRPWRSFLFFAVACMLAYVPLALAFTPWRWADQGPFALQFSRPLLYALFYLLGVAIGAHGLDRGLLCEDGALATHWRALCLMAFASLLFWMGLTGWSLTYAPAPAPFILQLVADAGFAVACAASVMFVMGVSLKFGAFRSAILDNLSKNAMGIYLLHYLPVVWLQYALKDTDAPAVAKVVIVFGGALLVSWLATEFLRVIPFGARLIGEEATAFRPRAAV
jgi:hypothetical protein